MCNLLPSEPEPHNLPKVCRNLERKVSASGSGSACAAVPERLLPIQGKALSYVVKCSVVVLLELLPEGACSTPPPRSPLLRAVHYHLAATQCSKVQVEAQGCLI